MQQNNNDIHETDLIMSEIKTLILMVVMYCHKLISIVVYCYHCDEHCWSLSEIIRILKSHLWISEAGRRSYASIHNRLGCSVWIICQQLWQTGLSHTIMCMCLGSNSSDLLKSPWSLPWSYFACVRDSLDTLKTTLCECLGINTSRSASKSLDAPISLCANIQGSLDALITTVCQHPGTKMPCSMPTSRNQKTLT